jgi:pimeloyl-ACP methyl ester carboxylesterase
MKILLVVLLADGVRHRRQDRRSWGRGDPGRGRVRDHRGRSAATTQAQIHQAKDMLAAALGTTNVVVPGTGHNQMLYQPQAIADQIVTFVDDVRVRQ